MVTRFQYALLLISCCISSTTFSEEPWGKDASLTQTASIKVARSPFDPFQQAILFHQTILSPADGPRSHFYPSSSEYAKRAINHWGTQDGLLLTFDRLMRENNEPWVYPVAELPSKIRLKYDPAP